MSATGLRTRVMLHGAWAGFLAIALIDLCGAALGWAMQRKGMALTHSTPIKEALLLMVTLPVFGASFLGMMMGDVLRRMPGAPLLRRAHRTWLWQVTLGATALQWMILELPGVLMLWPTQPLAALCMSVAVPFGATILSLAGALMLPPQKAVLAFAPAMALDLWLALSVGNAPTEETLQYATLISIAVIALTPWVLRHVIDRLTDPTQPVAPAHPWLDVLSRIDVGPDKPMRLAWRALDALVLPTSPTGPRAWAGTLLFLIGLSWVVLRFGAHGVEALSQGHTGAWIIGMTSAPWFATSFWISPRGLLLPGTLHRPSLLHGLVRQVFKRNLSRLPLTVAALTAVLHLATGVSIGDAFALALIAPAPAAFSLAMALSLSGRSMGAGTVGALQAVCGLAHMLICRIGGQLALGLQFESGALWPWTALAWVSALPVLALAIRFNRSRWQQLDWNSMPERPSWLRALR